ncbi:transporter, MotA/TolQ/ExbB proton channel family protein [Leptospira inadai serovar Lyme str. 10]|uniref:Transporter, MotA/TolQ/ExbB proton channel family protein n=1 Tax=Leptospira inadai serovar Lyme str. 10 TaxID=1049790 RepID=V6HFW3_9LEPT|nr:motility protein A [Leptospira inadai]EQA38808.1 transporter, MotA/TolQ/ExbB proton channel family protein [Leptospira inadai serovar Lyme str. 10]
MDIASLIGLGSALVVVAFGILSAGLNPIDIVDIPSVLITFGGATACTIMAVPWQSTLDVGKITRKAFREEKSDLVELIKTLVSFSEKARREGLLALEDDVNELPEEFLRKGITLVVDGTDPELVRNIMETEMGNIATRHAQGKAWWENWGALAPAFGMIGTLIGLVQMLKNLGSGDPSAIGTGMAAALITTLYGSMGANMFAIPIMKKLIRKSEDELLIKQIMIEKTLSIQSGDNPRIVKDKLASFLPPSERGVLKEEGD